MTGTSQDIDPACAVAHGAGPEESTTPTRTLVAVFASPVAEHLLRYSADLGYRPVLLEPDPVRAAGTAHVSTPAGLAGDTDVVVTDHHRPELALVLRELLARKVRWIGLMDSPRHPGPHLAALAGLVADRNGRPGGFTF